MEYSAIRENRISSDESQLVLVAQKGNLEAFNELVLMYQDAVYNLAYRILGDSDSAEDITQNSFLIAFRSLHGFRNGSFRSWLFRIATNACYDELRRRGRHPLLSIESADETEERFFPLYDLSRPEISPEQECVQHELEQAVQQALNALEPDQRAVIVLVDLQDMDYQEAANVLQIPIGTVKSRLARGREHLRQIILHRGI
jgi:RNA polymerase sigma factor (sigma-70 family)